MKKGFLFGLGILFAGVAFAAIVTIDTKVDGSSLLPSEFNQVTTALNSFENACAADKVLTGFTGDGSGNLSFQCVDDQVGGAGTSPWGTVSAGISYTGGDVGIGAPAVDPKTTLDVSGGTVLAKEFCFDGDAELSCTDGTCTSGTGLTAGVGNSTCVSQESVNYLEDLFTGGGGGGASSPWTTVFAGINYATGNVGIGTANPTEKLHITGNVKTSGSVQVGGNECPAFGTTCTKAGEIATCGGGGAVMACADVGSQWMPITSHNGTVVGSTVSTCSSTTAGIMKFSSGGSPTIQVLSICMMNSGSQTYSWRTILNGGGQAGF